MSVRSFIALSLSEQMINALGDAAAKMAYQDKSNAVRWVDQENFHITLAFLGDQEMHTLESLAEYLDDQLPYSTLQLDVTHLSPFPENKPKLIAAMIEATDELKSLQQLVINSLVANNVVFDKRKFMPHVTLGRLRHSRNHFAGSIPRSLECGDNAVDVSIFESILTPNGAEYEALFRFPLDFDYFELTSEE